MLTPELGEGIFFDTRNYHFITPGHAGPPADPVLLCRRATDNRLIIWA